MTKINRDLSARNEALESEKINLYATIQVLNGDRSQQRNQDGGKISNVVAQQQSSEDNFTKITSKKKKSNKKKPKQNAAPGSSTKTGPSGKVANGSTKPPSTTAVVLGDSIIKRLNSYRMSKDGKSKVISRSFSGARVRDMYDYMKPTLQAVSKPCNVVLHVGTNDLQDKSAQEVADLLVDLAQHIEDKYPETKVSFSELTPRQDSQGPSTKVNNVNKVLFAVWQTCH